LEKEKPIPLLLEEEVDRLLAFEAGFFYWEMPALGALGSAPAGSLLTLHFLCCSG